MKEELELTNKQLTALVEAIVDGQEQTAQNQMAMALALNKLRDDVTRLTARVEFLENENNPV